MTEAAKKVSRVSVPERCNPHARLVFQLMRETGFTYDEVEYRSGILRSTLKSYRLEKTPSLQSIEALLGVWGYTLVPVPPLSSLKPETLDAIEEISLDFKSDHEALAAIMARVCSVPVELPAAENINVETKIEPTIRRRPKAIEGQVALEFAA